MKIEYTKKGIEFNLSQMSLNMDLSAILYSKVDSDFLKKEISGKSRKEAENILRGKPQIVKFEIRLSPFFLNQIPQDPGKIAIILKVDPVTNP